MSLARRRKAGIPVQVTVVLTPIHILVAKMAVGSKFPSRAIDVEIQIRKVSAARKLAGCSSRKRIVPAVARIPCRRVPCFVEAARNTAGCFHRSNLAGRRAAADKTGRKWVLGIAAAIHCHIWDFFVQPSVVDFASRIRRFGR